MPDNGNETPNQPVEIPWKLEATSRLLDPQGLGEGLPEGSTLAIFKWEPELPSTDHARRLIYYKFTVSFVPDMIRLPDNWAAAQTEELLSNYFTHPIRIGKLTLRLTSGGAPAYFVDATPRQRTITEDALGSFKVSMNGSSSLSVGKSESTLHDQTTVGVTTTTDPGASWGINLGGYLSLGGSGDTTQTTTTTAARDSNQALDVTQRNASTERSELFSYTTRLTNTLSVLEVSHIGSPYLQFTLWAPPISTMPDTGRTDANRSYAEALRWRSSGLTGVQEFFAVVSAPREDLTCVEAQLDTVHVLTPHPPQFPERHGFVASEKDREEVLDFLYRRYPAGFPLDRLDVDVTDTLRMSDGAISAENVRQASLNQWRDSAPAWSDGPTWLTINFVAFGIVRAAGAMPPVVEPVYGFYKPWKAVWLDMAMEKYAHDLANIPISGVLPIVKSLAITACEKAAPHIVDFPVRLLDVNLEGVRVNASQRGALEHQLAASLQATPVSARPPMRPDHPRVRDALLFAAAASDSALSIDTASALGVPSGDIAEAKKAGLSTLGEFARDLQHRPIRAAVREHQRAAEEVGAPLNGGAAPRVADVPHLIVQVAGELKRRGLSRLTQLARGNVRK